jgi:hypothetical protein
MLTLPLQEVVESILRTRASFKHDCIKVATPGRGCSEVTKVGISSQVSCTAAAGTIEDGEGHQPLCIIQRNDFTFGVGGHKIRTLRYQLVAGERTLRRDLRHSFDEAWCGRGLLDGREPCSRESQVPLPWLRFMYVSCPSRLSRLRSDDEDRFLHIS